MTKKKNLFTYLLVIVLFIVALFSYFSYNHIRFSAADSDFKVSRQQELRKIVLSKNEQSIDLSPSNSSEWWINGDLSANISAVEQLRSILNAIEVRHPSSLAYRDSLNAQILNTGTRVQLYLRNYLIQIGDFRLLGYNRLYQDFWVGMDVNDSGAYMKKHGSENSFVIYVPGWEGSLRNVFSSQVRNWINPVIIDLSSEDIKIIELNYHEKPHKSFRLENIDMQSVRIKGVENQEYINPLEVDTLNILQYLSSFEELHYESIPDDQAELVREKLMYNEPWAYLSIETHTGRILSFDLYLRKNDPAAQIIPTDLPYDPNRFYIKLSDDQYALAQFYVFHRILRGLDFFKLQE